MLEKIFPGYALKRESAKLRIKLVNHQMKALESLPSFARDNDEELWLNIYGDSKQIYTEAEICDMQLQALKISYSPQGRNVLETMESFVIGKNAKITAVGLKEDNKLEEIQKYWEGFAKQEKFDKRSKELLRRTMRDGESFLRFFEPSITAEINEQEFTKVRFIEPKEIQDRQGRFTYGIETDPNDIENVLNYHRLFPQRKTSNDLQSTENQEVIPADEIIHTKILVDSNVKRGISFLIGVAKYIRKYESWLDDRINLNKIRSIFNLIGNIEGPGDISNVTDQFSDVTGKTPTGGTAKKRMPKPGSVLMNRGVKWEYQSLNIRAQDTKDDGRNIQLMAASGIQFPEYIFRADASNSNMASTMIAESPFVRMIEKYQDIFQDVFKEIFWKVINFGRESKQIELSDEEMEKLDCQVDFATLIHRDLKAETEAYTIHDNQGYASRQTISGMLGYDFEEEQVLIKKETEELDKRELDRERLASQNNPNQPNNNRNRNDN